MTLVRSLNVATEAPLLGWTRLAANGRRRFGLAPTLHESSDRSLATAIPECMDSACRNAAMLQPSCQTLNVIWSKSIEPTPSLYGRTPQIRGGADFEEFAHRRALEA